MTMAEWNGNFFRGVLFGIISFRKKAMLGGETTSMVKV
jgi:hypothetical protein